MRKRTKVLVGILLLVLSLNIIILNIQVYHRAQDVKSLDSNMKAMIYVFYTNDVRLKNELTKQRFEILQLTQKIKQERNIMNNRVAVVVETAVEITDETLEENQMAI